MYNGGRNSKIKEKNAWNGFPSNIFRDKVLSRWWKFIIGKNRTKEKLLLKFYFFWEKIFVKRGIQLGDQTINQRMLRMCVWIRTQFPYRMCGFSHSFCSFFLGITKAITLFLIQFDIQIRCITIPCTLLYNVIYMNVHRTTNLCTVHSGINLIGNHWLFFRTSINSHYLFSLCFVYIFFYKVYNTTSNYQIYLFCTP